MSQPPSSGRYLNKISGLLPDEDKNLSSHSHEFSAGGDNVSLYGTRQFIDWSLSPVLRINSTLSAGQSPAPHLFEAASQSAQPSAATESSPSPAPETAVWFSIFGAPDGVDPPTAPPAQPAKAYSEILVQFAATADAAQKSAAIASVGGEIVETVRAASGAKGDLLLIKIGEPDSGKAIETLSHDPAVKFAESNGTIGVQVVPNDSYYTNGNLWGMYGDQTSPANTYGSQAGEAWAVNHLGSTSVVIGDIDTGIDYTHPDLYLNIWLNQHELPNFAFVDTDGDGSITFRDLNQVVNASFVSDLNANSRIDAGDLLQDIRYENGADNDGNGYIDDLVGWDWVNDDNAPFDDQYHGTHTSGTIGAMGFNGSGVIGVSPNVQIMALKFLSSAGSGSSSDAIQALDYYTDAATANPSDVFAATSNSWGGGSPSQSLYDAILRGAENDILFVAAAGNNGSNTDNVGNYPSNYSTLADAGYDAVISVAAIQSNGALASFSNYGAATVDLGAPGVSVISTVPGGYSSLSGTSMAAPHVAGALALFAAEHPEMSAAQLREVLLSSTVATSSLSGKTVTGGRLNADAMFDGVASEPETIVSIVPNLPLIQEGNSGSTPVSFTVGLSRALAVGATVNWTLSGSGTAPTSATDFTGPTSGTVTFNPGVTQQAIQINIAGDTAVEPIEQFTITLSNPSSALSLGQASATASILNDDDDYPFDATTTATVTVNGSASTGSIDFASDADAFRVSLVAGTTYRFNQNATSSLDTFLYLYDNNFVQLASNDDANGTNSQITYTATQSGTFYLGARGWSTSVGSYSLTAVSLAQPEIAVSGNSVNIADGDTTPSATDFTDFGSVTQGSAAIIRTFTVNNTGTATLTTSGLTLPTGFSVVEGLSASIAAGGSDTFQVQLDTASSGAKSGQISFTTNDGDENPFNFSITGTVNPLSAPEIAVSGNSTNIADGDTTPSSGDHTDFGSATQSGVPIIRTFTVNNTGTATLTTSGLTLPTGFSVVEGLSASIVAGGSDTFQVQLDTVSSGAKSGQISFTTNDADENPFNFSITGTVNPPAAPEIAISGNSTNIADGDTTPSSGDHTDFGSATQGGAAIIRTFTVSNTGTAALTTSGLTLPSGFSVVEGLSTSIAAGGSDTFQVQLDTANSGSKSGQISFTTNDGDENPFNFSIAGTVNANSGSGVTINGTSGNDTIHGTSTPIGQPLPTNFDDIINGLGGNDSLNGLAGNDTLDGGSGSDTMIGGPGDDTFIVNATMDVVTENANEGTDTVQSSITLSLVANVENLTLTGTSAINGTGNALANTMVGNSANNILTGGAGPDVLDGGAGTDRANYATSSTGVNVSLWTGLGSGGDAQGDTLSNIEDVTGSNANDTLEGNSGNNALNGGSGTDTLTYVSALAAVTVNLALTSAQNTVGAGSDTVSGFENLTGSNFNDTLTGSTANNTIMGLDGNDTIDGGSGSDNMFGGDGDDIYVVGTTGDVVTENPDEGTDTVRSTITYTLLANVENLTLIGTSSINGTGNSLANIITGNSGNNILAGLGGADVLNGGAGTDTASYAASTFAVNVSLATGLGSGGDAAGDTYISIENATGSNFDDTIEGNSGTNVLAGGSGIDTVTYVSAATGVAVNLATTFSQNTGGAGSDTMSGFENLTGSNFNDTLTGSSAANVIRGLNGNDTLNGGSGADSMFGGVGNDTYVVENSGDVVTENPDEGTDIVQSSISYALTSYVENLTLTGTSSINGTGNELGNIITGNSGSNILSGGDGNDTLLGNGGNDQLIGGSGADSMTGGSGADRFIFASAADFAAGALLDTISDFQGSAGDRIDLSGVDANSLTSPTNEAFAFIGTAAFGLVAGQLRYQAIGGGVAVSGDMNGDGNADFALNVLGVASLTATDFVV